MRPGRPRTIREERVAELLQRTLNTRSEVGMHWSCHRFALKHGISKSTVQRLWRTFQLAPHRHESFKLHQFGFNPAGGQHAQAIGRTKGGLNTKLCALVEGNGRLMAAAMAPRQVYEVEASAPLLEKLRHILLVGDKGFDSDALREQLRAQGCLACVPSRSGRRCLAWYHRSFYR
jgi:hypothetical protein